MPNWSLFFEQIVKKSALSQSYISHCDSIKEQLYYKLKYTSADAAAYTWHIFDKEV